MINICDYRGHLRNWRALCGELGIKTDLSRVEREKEIIVRAYEKWGSSMGDHFYGMFAFALYDTEENKYFCLRDQFGTKPFYYYITKDNRLLFGTNISRIIGQEGFVKELNADILNELIDKIVVHHKEKLYGKTYQQVEIYYRFVGELKETVAKAA